MCYLPGRGTLLIDCVAAVVGLLGLYVDRWSGGWEVYDQGFIKVLLCSCWGIQEWETWVLEIVGG